MTENLISSKSIIAKVIADLNLPEHRIRITDWKEWIAEALHKIGAIQQYDRKVLTIQIKDYQAKLPNDLEKILFVAYSKDGKHGWIPMKKSTGHFSVFYNFDDNANTCETGMLFQDDALIPLVKNIFNTDNNREALDILNGDNQNIRKTLSALLNQYTVHNKNGLANCVDYSNTVQYDIKPGYIVSNIKNGFIKLSYIATYVDGDGMPMIPDSTSYSEAIYWYIVMKMLYAEYFKGQADINMYNDAKMAWNFYRNQAYGEAMMPDQNDMLNISNTWHTLVPEIESDKTFLSTLGDQQVIYNQDSLWK